MSYVYTLAKKANMCCATLTFDQTLFLKAKKIKADSGSEFDLVASIS